MLATVPMCYLTVYRLISSVAGVPGASNKELPMGLFTYRQTKQTKKQIKGLRADQTREALAQRTQQATLAAHARETELFQALPPEGKEEFRAVKAAFDAQAKTWSSFKHGWGGK